MPVIVTLAAAIKIKGQGPVIFSQKRIGRNGKPFTLYKFRSLRNGNEEEIVLISGREDKRITSIGRFLRKHKLDEIPNFINVLKGEMSIVGPRPERLFFINQIIKSAPQYIELHKVKPGITSWGQVKYGYASSVNEMIERLDYDLFYLKNRSAWFDMKIITLTIGTILRGKGI